MKRRFFCFGLLATLLPWKKQSSTSTSTASKNSALSDQTIRRLKALVIAQYSKQLHEEMDDLIVNGTGGMQPQGILNT